MDTQLALSPAPHQSSSALVKKTFIQLQKKHQNRFSKSISLSRKNSSQKGLLKESTAYPKKSDRRVTWLGTLSIAKASAIHLNFTCVTKPAASVSCHPVPRIQCQAQALTLCLQIHPFDIIYAADQHEG